MKLIDLSLVLILASYSEGHGWNISVTREHVVQPGSDLIIPCSVTIPKGQQIKDIFWKIPGESNCSFIDNNLEAFIFHSDDNCVEEKYRKKTRLVGNATSGNCSLKISNIMEGVQEMYVRVYTSEVSQTFSFKEDLVSIVVKAKNTWMYVAILVPVSALLIILLVSGLFFCKRHKRSQSLKRKESGYYANFSRTSSEPPKREVLDKKDMELPDLKAIDEPVYINVEAPTYEMDQSMDGMDSIYANVDYTK